MQCGLESFPWQHTVDRWHTCLVFDVTGSSTVSSTSGVNESSAAAAEKNVKALFSMKWQKKIDVWIGAEAVLMFHFFEKDKLPQHMNPNHKVGLQ